PGRPFLYITSSYFLDYFGLHTLEQLPPLSEQTDIDPEEMSGNLFLQAFEKRQREGEQHGTTTKSNG
ncbi:MAG: SMC-Scp complex subunit ScpB, partial [Paucilactobacillus nenjiangensis]